MVSRPKKVNWQNPSGKTQIPCHFATSPLQPQNHRPMYDRMGLFSWKGEPMNNDTSNRSIPAMFSACPTTETGRTAGHTPPKSTSEKSSVKSKGILPPGVLMIRFTSKTMLHLAMTRVIL